MFIDLSKLKQQLKKNEQFVLEKRFSDKLLNETNGHFLEPCEVHITVEHTGRLYIAQGNLKTKIKLQCSRCLKDTVYNIDTGFDFVLVEAIYEHEFSEEEDDIIFFQDTLIDITPIVQETVLVNLPIRILCKEDCKGLCPKCGVDKNTEQCNCQERDIDPRWEKLKDLRK
ncbi:MAG: DUF177 domain-containing protein [Syntrophomonadaceae bacterium]|nr:DUF177 domain-containing protein [Syntrophomonadaceae bacterium]